MIYPSFRALFSCCKCNGQCKAVVLEHTDHVCAKDEEDYRSEGVVIDKYTLSQSQHWSLGSETAESVKNDN